MAAVRSAHADGLMVVTDPVLQSQRGRIVAFATRHRLPVVAERKEFAELGGLMTYGVSLPAQWRRAAYYVDRILKGYKPADLPVEQPREFELIMNLKSAKALGLTIPPSVLFQADEVIR